MCVSWHKTIITTDSYAIFPSLLIQLFFKSQCDLFILLDHIISKELRKMLLNWEKMEEAALLGLTKDVCGVEYSLYLGLVRASWWDQHNYCRAVANATCLVTSVEWIWGHRPMHFSTGEMGSSSSCPVLLSDILVTVRALLGWSITQ